MKNLVSTLKIAATAVVVLASQSLFAADEINLTENDIAVSGYDRVAYFAAGKSTKGKTKYTAAHDDPDDIRVQPIPEQTKQLMLSR